MLRPRQNIPSLYFSPNWIKEIKIVKKNRYKEQKKKIERARERVWVHVCESKRQLKIDHQRVNGPHCS